MMDGSDAHRAVTLHQSLLSWQRQKLACMAEERVLWLQRLAGLESELRELHEARSEAAAARSTISSLEATLRAAEAREALAQQLQHAMPAPLVLAVDGGEPVWRWPSAALLSARAARIDPRSPTALWRAQPYATEVGHLRAEAARAHAEAAIVRGAAARAEEQASCEAAAAAASQAALASAQQRLTSLTREYLLTRHTYHERELQNAEALEAVQAADARAARRASTVAQNAPTQSSKESQGGGPCTESRVHASLLAADYEARLSAAEQAHAAALATQVAACEARILAQQAELVAELKARLRREQAHVANLESRLSAAATIASEYCTSATALRERVEGLQKLWSRRQGAPSGAATKWMPTAPTRVRTRAMLVGGGDGPGMRALERLRTRGLGIALT